MTQLLELVNPSDGFEYFGVPATTPAEKIKSGGAEAAGNSSPMNHLPLMFGVSAANEN